MSKSSKALSFELDSMFITNPHKAVRHTWGSFRPTERIVEGKRGKGSYNRQKMKAETRRMINE